jgi:membrane associated rhomboid family serine protease
LRLDEPVERVPWATLGIALACGLAFLWSRSQPDAVLRPLCLDPAAFSPIQLVTSGLLHADVFHLAGNLVFLLVFGRYVETRTGPWRFLLLYLAFELGGDVAFLVLSWATAQDAAALGASAAISGTLGFTLVAVPRARVLVVWFPNREGELPRFPVALYLGLWIFLLLPGVLGTPYLGLAWAAHLGGFLTGVGLALLLFGERTRGSAWHLERDAASGSPVGRRRRRQAALYRAAAEALRAEHGGERVSYAVGGAPAVPPAGAGAGPESEPEASDAAPTAPAVPRRSREDDWTLAEGVRSVVGVLGSRLLFVLPLSVVFQGGVLAPMSRVPNVGLLAVVFGLALGTALGALLAWGLIARVHFVGWIPTGLAWAAAAVAVFGGGALADLWNPIQGEMVRALALVALSIGAAAAVYRFTGLE